MERWLFAFEGHRDAMFPFESRWRWLFSTGYLHLVEAIREHMESFEEPFDEILRDRAKKTERALRVRAGVMVLLNLGLIATTIAWVSRFVPILGDVETVASTLAASLTGLSLLMTALYLVISRYLGQLQADMISSMALGTSIGAQLAPEELARLRKLEAEAQDRGWFPDMPGR